MTDIGYRWIEWPYARLRRELDVDGGVPTRFVYQLEYDLDATVDGFPPRDILSRLKARASHPMLVGQVNPEG